MVTNPPGMPPPSPRPSRPAPVSLSPPPTLRPPPRPYAWARWVNVVLGAWLFVSPFLWQHTPTSDANSWIVGLLIIVVAVVALYLPQARWLNTALAVWLFFSTLVFAHTAPTMWNNLIVALIVFVASLMPEGLNPRSGPDGMGRRSLP